MTDVRALLAAERSSRRISHPLLSYTKSGLLQCTACSLNIRSESLWDGHLKSANHKKNAGAVPTSKKRKIDDDEEADEETGKKPRSVRFKGMPPAGFVNTDGEANGNGDATISNGNDVTIEDGPLPAIEGADVTSPKPETQALPNQPSYNLSPLPASATQPQPPPTVDEDEWAAFERDLAPLTKDPPQQTDPSYTAAIITAPALSAADLAAQSTAQPNQRRDRDAEAQDEKEESEARLADEFAVLEEMEERVRRLREKREALRVANTKTSSDINIDVDTGQAETKSDHADEKGKESGSEEEDDDDGEDADDWFS